MAEDLMRYDQLAQDALRGVVREALRKVKRTGLPGEHHFYIAFNTKHPGVVLSERLAARYPREMTIVLQHQFWNLTVDEDRFEVELSFNEIPEKLVVPFAAVKGFLDPAVQFGLQFEVMSAEQPPIKARETAAENGSDMPVADQEADADADVPKVVSLDSFRKK